MLKLRPFVWLWDCPVHSLYYSIRITVTPNSLNQLFLLNDFKENTCMSMNDILEHLSYLLHDFYGKWVAAAHKWSFAWFLGKPSCSDIPNHSIQSGERKCYINGIL